MPTSSLTDFWRSKSKHFSSMMSAVTSFAVTTFTVMLGASLGVQIEISALTRASVGFRSIFSTFIFVTAVISLVLSVITFTNLTATVMDNRARDIAIFKTSGGSVDKIYSFFMTQAIQMTFLLGGLSIILGIIISAASFLVLYILTGVSLQFSIPILELVIILALLVGFSVFFGHRYVARAVRIPVVESFSPQILDVDQLRSEGWIARKTSRPGSPLRVAFRNVRRTRRFALRLGTCIFLSMILTTSIMLGGVVADQTTTSYLTRALNEQFIFVGHQDVWIQYSSLIGFQIQPSYNSSFDYLNPRYRINDSVIEQLSSLPGISKIDPRITYETLLEELRTPVLYIDENGTERYRLVGDDREATVLLSGVDPDEVISDWFTYGRFVNSSDYPLQTGGYSTVVIGDSVQTIFEDALVQKADILSKQFVVVGIVLDPVNSGWTAYMLRSVLGSLLGYNGSNMLLVRCDPGTFSDTLALIQGSVAVYGFSAFSMGPVVREVIDFLNFAWFSALIPAGFLFFTLGMSVVSYMNLTFEINRRDFGIMRAVGAPPHHIRKTILRQGIIVSLWPALSGTLIGLIVSIWFFIPSAVVTPLSVVIWMAVLMLLPLTASVAAAVVSFRASDRPAVDIMR